MKDQFEDSEGRIAARASIRYGDSRIGLQRLIHNGQGAMACCQSPEDAYVVIMQMGALPRHDYWIHGRHHSQPGGGSNAISIFHLADEPSCRIAEANDNLHLLVPRTALDELADDAGAARIQHLRSDGWEQHDAVVDGLKHAIAASFAHQCRGSSLFIDHAVLALHTHIARVYGGMRPVERPVLGGLAPWQERRAKEILADRLDSELALSAVAEACGLSLSHFMRAFKASMATTPHAWRQVRRIERAKSLLDGTDQSLADIALACGFSDQSHFTRVFSAIAGDTPGAWRRRRAA
jgi:AraC family transcriptional regulator